MARKSKAQRLAEVHARALQEFDDSFLATQRDRENALMARRFVNVRGAMWDWDTQGQFSNRMRIEVDQISPSLNRIKNEYRRNRIEAKFIPADGTEADDLADAVASRYRADTCDARGRQARDMAFDSALEGGFGGLRLRAEYERGEYQKICLEPVNDAEGSLFFDANAKMQDKSDAEHAFLITPWVRRAFVAKYGEECSSWPQDLVGQYQFQWFGNGVDLVYVAEYFVKERRKDRYRVFELQGAVEETQEFLDDDLEEEAVADLLAQGFVEVEGRVEEVDQIVKYVLNGNKVLEDRQVIPGKCIPLIPQYGHRTVINFVESFRGHVLKSIDPQIIYNVQVSTVTETAASSGIEKPVFTPDQIARHAVMWQNDHLENNAFLLIDPIPDANGNLMPSGPVTFTKSPDVAPSVAALIALTKQDISDQLGNPQNAEQVQPDVSGVAMEMVQGRIDMQSYGYMDNAAEAERRLAEVWLSMAAEVYVEKGRKLKTLSADGRRGMVELGKPILDAKTGKTIPEVDFSRVEMEIETEVGPTSASRRSAIVRQLVPLINATPDPETQIALQHMALQNLEGEGIADLREWSRKKLVGMGIVKPTPEGKAEMAAAAQQPPPPDPQVIAAEAMTMEAEARMLTAQANAGLTVARTEETQAKTAATLAEIPREDRKAAVATAEAIMGQFDAGQ